MSLQFGGLIRNQIRYEAKDEIKSRIGRIRPLDGNLLQQFLNKGSLTCDQAGRIDQSLHVLLDPKGPRIRSVQ